MSEDQNFPTDHSNYHPVKTDESPQAKMRLGGMYQNWFLDYASYVILDRAVPHLADGLKPVQRRIMYTMKRMDDERYNKVANIVGHTMSFHPHGDASIYGALVQLGQKDLLVDCQGNWGNILTGDSAAAPRYIEARLSKFALDVMFNKDTTEWKLSYDGRAQEPVTLPVKFPLLLAQGAEGIAVGLSAKILPHNFNELCDAAVSYLTGQPFTLYPDFQTGCRIDVSKYNDGMRGGSVRIRTKIEKIDNKTLAIREMPYGKTSKTLIPSIISAIEKGKINVRKVDDHTAREVEILIHLAPGTSSEKAIDALYAFTDCETTISPLNCCVIHNDKPVFMGISDVLRFSVDQTKNLLQRELEIKRDELTNRLHYASLEALFINERIYKDRNFETASTMDEAVAHIDKRLSPFYPQLVREVTRDDILRLMEIKMGRILKFNKERAEEAMVKIREEIDRINHDLGNMVEVTCNWFRMLKERYGANFPRRSQIASFDNIEAAKVAEANQKLYINREEGFIGTSLKKDEFICQCSDLDDAIIFYRDGTYKVVRILDKLFVGETEKSKKENRKAEIIYIAVFKKNDKRTIYNVIYHDGRKGNYFQKRFFVSGITRDHDYDLTAGTPGSRVVYFTANPNGEAEVVRVTLKPQPKLKRLTFDLNFADLKIKGRNCIGNLATKNPVYRISLKTQGASTLGGRKVWFDNDTLRLNYDEHGTYIGEYQGSEHVLVIRRNGMFYTTSFDLSNHYDNDILIIEKYNPRKVWTAIVNDTANGNVAYLKRFQLPDTKKPSSIVGEDKNVLLHLTSVAYPRFSVSFTKNGEETPQIEIDADEFTTIKSHKMRGRRLDMAPIAHFSELEPLREPDPEPEEPESATSNAEPINLDPDAGKTDQQLIDEQTGQLNLFDL